MNPKEPLPLSKSDKLTEVDEELESAIDRLSKASENVEDVLQKIEEGQERDEEETSSEETD